MFIPIYYQHSWQYQLTYQVHLSVLWAWTKVGYMCHTERKNSKVESQLQSTMYTCWWSFGEEKREQKSKLKQLTC